MYVVRNFGLQRIILGDNFVCLGRDFSLANVQKDEARPPAADEGNFYNMVRVWYMVSETHTIF